MDHSGAGDGCNGDDAKMKNGQDDYTTTSDDRHLNEISVIPKSPSNNNLTQATNGDSIETHNGHQDTGTHQKLFPSSHQNKRPSLIERRHSRTPFSAPPDTTSFSPTVFNDEASSEMLKKPRPSGTRKTSLPTIVCQRPTDLDVPSWNAGGVQGASGGQRQRTRVSESNYLPLDNGNNSSMSKKSISDNRLINTTGASYNPDENGSDDDQLNETKIVVQTFMAAAYQRAMEQIMIQVPNDEESPMVAEAPTASGAAVMTGISTPDLPSELQASPLSPTADVGRRLALMADEFDQRYGVELDDMARLVLPYILDKAGSNSGSGWSLTFDAFSRVARRLFENAQITWGRIVALLSFGYRLVMALLRANLPGFITRIVGFVSRFIMVEPIANWISTQGGWIKALVFQPRSENPQMQAMVEIGYVTVQVVAIAILAWNWLRQGK